MIIFAPRQQLSEPAAENGPLWSYRRPILMVGAWASARGAHVLATATASTSAAARIIRADFIGGPPRKKWGAGYHAPVRRARTIHSRLCRPRGERSGGPARSIQNDGASSRRTSAGATTKGGPGVSARTGKKFASSQPPGRSVPTSERTYSARRAGSIAQKHVYSQTPSKALGSSRPSVKTSRPSKVAATPSRAASARAWESAAGAKSKPVTA